MEIKTKINRWDLKLLHSKANYKEKTAKDNPQNGKKYLQMVPLTRDFQNLQTSHYQKNSNKK